MIIADKRLKGYCTNRETMSMLQETGQAFEEALGGGALTDGVTRKYYDVLLRYERELSNSPWGRNLEGIAQAPTDHFLRPIVSFELTRLSAEISRIGGFIIASPEPADSEPTDSEPTDPEE